MISNSKNILLLALGNELLGDDGVGFAVARALKTEYQDRVDIYESGEAGLALLEIMEGYHQVLLLDSISKDDCPAGTILEYSPADFQKIVAPSPHYAGIPEVLQMAVWYDIPFPKDIHILTMQVEKSYEFRESLSPVIQHSLPIFENKARQLLNTWLSRYGRDSSRPSNLQLARNSI